MSTMNPSTRSQQPTTTEEFIERHMSLIVASVIGVIILMILIGAGIMYLTKKKDSEKSNKSNSSNAKSRGEPSPIQPLRNRSSIEKSTTKSSVSGESSMSKASEMSNNTQTDKSMKAQPVKV